MRCDARGGGEGGAGIRLRDELVGRSLAPAAFTALQLSVDWADEPKQAVVQGFCAWQALLLLIVWNLEPAARARAGLVQAYYRLYPEVIAESAIKAALVGNGDACCGGAVGRLWEIVPNRMLGLAWALECNYNPHQGDRNFDLST